MIRPNLPSDVPNFFSGLASRQFRRGIETQLPQSRDALVKYVREVIFHMNKCSSEARLGQQQRTGINEHRQEKTSAPHDAPKDACRRAVRPCPPIRRKRAEFRLYILEPLPGNRGP